MVFDDRKACVAAGKKLRRTERALEAAARRKPGDMRLRSRIGMVQKQIMAAEAKCAADARRKRQVRDAQAQAEKQRHQTERAQAQEEARRAKLQTKRERFELKQQRWEHVQARRAAGERVITTGQVATYAGIGALGLGAFFWLR
jgi:hypothetical protein